MIYSSAFLLYLKFELSSLAALLASLGYRVPHSTSCARAWALRPQGTLSVLPPASSGTLHLCLPSSPAVLLPLALGQA